MPYSVNMLEYTSTCIPPGLYVHLRNYLVVSVSHLHNPKSIYLSIYIYNIITLHNSISVTPVSIQDLIAFYLVISSHLKSNPINLPQACGPRHALRPFHRCWQNETERRRRQEKRTTWAGGAMGLGFCWPALSPLWLKKMGAALSTYNRIYLSTKMIKHESTMNQLTNIYKIHIESAFSWKMLKGWHRWASSWAKSSSCRPSKISHELPRNVEH